MVETSRKRTVGDYIKDGLPADCGYNQRFKHSYGIGSYGIGMHCIQKIAEICDKRRWGWYFKPTEKMDYGRQDWYEDQECFISFESKQDLIQVILSVDFN